MKANSKNINYHVVRSSSLLECHVHSTLLPSSFLLLTTLSPVEPEVTPESFLRQWSWRPLQNHMKLSRDETYLPAPSLEWVMCLPVNVCVTWEFQRHLSLTWPCPVSFGLKIPQSWRLFFLYYVKWFWYEDSLGFRYSPPAPKWAGGEILVLPLLPTEVVLTRSGSLSGLLFPFL